MDFKIKGRNNFRISLSNLYKEVECPNDFTIHFPVELDNQWTILVTDVYSVLSNTGLFEHNPDGKFDLASSFSMKSIQLCSSMNVRGVFTSDNLYSWNTLPGEMSFRAPTGVDLRSWEASFAWMCVPGLEDEMVSHAEEAL